MKTPGSIACFKSIKLLRVSKKIDDFFFLVDDFRLVYSRLNSFFFWEFSLVLEHLQPHHFRRLSSSSSLLLSRIPLSLRPLADRRSSPSTEVNASVFLRAKRGLLNRSTPRGLSPPPRSKLTADRHTSTRSTRG